MAPVRPARRERRDGGGGSGVATGMSAGSGLPSAARLVRACAKCHERKVKCDGTLPRCAQCVRAGAECNVSECVVWTHAHVVALDERVRWLEELVTRAYTTPDAGGIAACAPGTPLAPKRSFHSAPEHLPEEVGLLSLRASGCFLGSMSGVTLGIIINSAVRLFQDEPLSVDPSVPSPPSTRSRAALPPAPIARAYVARYIDGVHRWYPFLDLTRLGNDLGAAYDPGGAGPGALDEYARFVLFAICAIGAEQGGGDGGGAADPAADAFTPQEYFRTALAFLPPVAAQGSMDTLRALLLATVYSQRTWDDDGLNLWHVTGHCMRLAVEMGLTRNNPKWDYGEKEQEARRRVFWSAYAFERFVASSTGRIISVRREGAIDAQLPQVVDEAVPPALATFLQMTLPPLNLRHGVLLVRERQLLGDVLECVYQARAPGRPAPSVEETAARVFSMQATLVDWAQEVYSLQPGWERDVLLLAFHQATLWLHRPSPAFPSPTPEALDVCMGAARSSIKLRATAMSNGTHSKVTPGWNGFTRIVTDGLTLMYCSWIGAQCSTAIVSLAPDSMDPEIATSLALLDVMAQRSPHAPRYIALYRQVIVAFERILAQRQPLFATQGALGHGGAATTAAADIDTTLIAATLHNSGFASLTNVSLDEASIDYIARLLLGGEDAEPAL